MYYLFICLTGVCQILYHKFYKKYKGTPSVWRIKKEILRIKPIIFANKSVKIMGLIRKTSINQ